MTATGATVASSCIAMAIVRTIVLLASTTWGVTLGLRLTKLSIPTYRIRGEMALLECGHELEGDRLYSVKWYKDNEEFYRYVPRATPRQHSYKVDGVRVDHHLSDSMKVFLRSVTLRSSGVYRCEVSAEAPSFSSASGEGRMEVVFPPKEPPKITGGKNTYDMEDWVDLNCTAGKSHPAAALRWFINDYPAIPNWLIQRDPIPHGPHGLMSAVLGLRFRARPEQFLEPGPGGGGGGSDAERGGGNGRRRDGSPHPYHNSRIIRLRCVATISALLWEGDGSVESRFESRGVQASEGRREDGPDASPALSPVIDSRESLFIVRAAASGFSSSPTLTLLLAAMSAFVSSRLIPSLFLASSSAPPSAPRSHSVGVRGVAATAPSFSAHSPSFPRIAAGYAAGTSAVAATS
ncbi:uncharacterized protein LOC124155726 [Ischnura elegans]|uniref:uncharacterized protein LOC124155726 n=1 Tax=Ischnura elegans TaxID=197161 RepID=UPI001ED88E85|nr:uncharacterized protein LOC124155726 [Ischnura elegans]